MYLSDLGFSTKDSMIIYNTYKAKPKEILETNAGAVVSSHCGPGTLGVLFIAK